MTNYLNNLENINENNGIYTIKNKLNNKIVKLDSEQYLGLKNGSDILDKLKSKGFFDNDNHEILFKRNDISFFDYKNVNTYIENGIGILGIPYDASSTGYTGSSSSPSTIRRLTSGYSNISKYLNEDGKVYNLLDKVYNKNIFDCGDVLYIPGESNNDLYSRIRKITNRLDKEYGINKLVSIGGDHSCSLPLIDSLNVEDIVVIKIDAHFDNLSPDYNQKVNHSNFMRNVSDINRVKKIVHVGVRESLYDKNMSDKDIVISSDSSDSIKQIIDGLELINKNIYLSIDMDCLDPSEFKSSSFLLPFGLSVNDLISTIKSLKNYNVVGVDIMEYNPLLDKEGKDKYTVINILKECINLIS